MQVGTVIKSTGSNYLVDCNGKTYECKMRGKIRLSNLRTTNPVAVGDYVNFEDGVIKEILPRKNFIIRKSINLSKESHIIASNLDQCMLIVTLIMPETALEFIDRFLLMAEAYNVKTIIVFNKLDLYSDLQDLLTETMEIYQRIGYKCVAVSAKTGEGIETLRELLKDKTTLISGNSGTGKSTLINKIDNNLTLKTGEISQYNFSGKHTTTFAEMFFLNFGGRIIDTPGIKGFGIIGLDKKDVSHNFPEFFSRLENCKFYNCTHTNEPGCAVKQAVENGEIAPSRYHSYISIISDDDNQKYRKSNRE